MSDLKIYLSAPAEFAAEAALHGPVSVMAYKIGRGFHLYRTPLPKGRLALMDVDCAGFTGFGPHGALIAELTAECRRGGYAGLCLDLPRPTPQLFAFARALDAQAGRLGLSLFLPEPYAGCAPGSLLLMSAQNTRGTYSGRLARLCGLYGAERLALELERVYTDYPLPARAGRGTVLRAPPAGLGTAFFSGELCANYASYRDRGRAHLVVWDDRDTLERKLDAARKLGVGAAFLYYPHTADILPALMRR